MTHVPKITHEEWLASVATLPKDHDLRPSDIANKALEIKYAEQATQDQYITADEARALGFGNAEFCILDGSNIWHTALSNCPYLNFTKVTNTPIKYRRKEVPTAPGVEGVRAIRFWPQTEAEPTCKVQLIDGFTSGEVIEMTRESAQKLQAETKDVCDWFSPQLMGSARVGEVQFSIEGIYTYKLKPNLVKLDGVLMTREAAVAIWESKKDTCDVWYRSDEIDWLRSDVVLMRAKQSYGAEYQLRPKAKKPVSLDLDIREGVIELLRELGFIHEGDDIK